MTPQEGLGRSRILAASAPASRQNARHEADDHWEQAFDRQRHGHAHGIFAPAAGASHRPGDGTHRPLRLTICSACTTAEMNTLKAGTCTRRPSGAESSCRAWKPEYPLARLANPRPADGLTFAIEDASPAPHRNPSPLRSTLPTVPRYRQILFESSMRRRLALRPRSRENSPPESQTATDRITNGQRRSPIPPGSFAISSAAVRVSPPADAR